MNEMSQEEHNCNGLEEAEVTELDTELEALLNDAQQDFGKLPEPKKKKEELLPGAPLDDMNVVWTEEFIKEATAQFERKMRECMAIQQQGAAGGAANLDELQAAANDMTKVVEAASKAAAENVEEPAAVLSQMIEAMKKLPSKQADVGYSKEELDKLVTNLSNMGVGEVGEDADDMEQFLPFMTNFMQKLLAKDLLHPVLSDMVDRYPEWLGDNRPKLSTEDFDKYNKQYEFMKQICEEYTTEKPTDSEDTKRKRFDKIAELMLKVQCCGTPPKDLVGEDLSFPCMDPTAAFSDLGIPNPAGDQCSIV